MNLQYLKTFLAVVRLGSISRASEEVGLTQPAASAHIKSLESTFGRPLFRRHARGVSATAFALELARSLGTLLDQAEAVVEQARTGSWEPEGTVYVGGPAEFMGTMMPAVLGSLERRGITTRLELGGRERLFSLFAEEAIELGIMAIEPDDAALDCAPLLVERLQLVASPSFQRSVHGLALQSEPLQLDSLESAPWLAYDESLPLIRQYMRQVFGLTLSTSARIVAPSLTLLRDTVIAGSGITVLPHYLCESALASGTLVVLHTPVSEPENQLYLVWRRQSLRQARVVLARDHCLAAFADQASVVRTLS